MSVFKRKRYSKVLVIIIIFLSPLIILGFIDIRPLLRYIYYFIPFLTVLIIFHEYHDKKLAARNEFIVRFTLQDNFQKLIFDGDIYSNNHYTHFINNYNLLLKFEGNDLIRNKKDYDRVTNFVTTRYDKYLKKNSKCEFISKLIKVTDGNLSKFIIKINEDNSSKTAKYTINPNISFKYKYHRDSINHYDFILNDKICSITINNDSTIKLYTYKFLSFEIITKSGTTNIRNLHFNFNLWLHHREKSIFTPESIDSNSRNDYEFNIANFDDQSNLKIPVFSSPRIFYFYVINPSISYNTKHSEYQKIRPITFRQLNEFDIEYEFGSKS
ncbi:MAG: hypothetical protein ACOCRK_09310 [bacterium]